MSPTSSNIIMADGILVGLNYFDMQLYAFGKGPSATTVTTQNDVSVLGTKIIVKGTVTDQTPFGRRNINDVLQFSLKGHSSNIRPRPALHGWNTSSCNKQSQQTLRVFELP